MARNRTDLSPIFKQILGSNNVFFQAPPTNQLKYPCILYFRDQRNVDHADNLKYRDHAHYTVTLIGRDPDNDSIVDALLELQYCSFDRRYVTDNLYHDVFDLYY